MVAVQGRGAGGICSWGQVTAGGLALGRLLFQSDKPWNLPMGGSRATRRPSASGRWGTGGSKGGRDQRDTEEERQMGERMASETQR